MKMQTMLSTLLAAVCLASTAAVHAEARSSAVLTLRDVRLLQADGTHFTLPPDLDRYKVRGHTFLQHGPERWLDFADGYTSWNLYGCQGACANFPPEDVRIGPGGYVHADTYGVMRLGMGLGNDGFSHLRADAARTGQGGSDAVAAIDTTMVFQATSDDPLTLALTAIPYLDLMMAGGTPDESVGWAEVRINVLLRDLASNEVIAHLYAPMLNQQYSLHSGLYQETGYIFAPGPQQLSLTLQPLVTGQRYALSFEQVVSTAVVLAVPEPAAATLMPLGLLVIGAMRCVSVRVRRGSGGARR